MTSIQYFKRLVLLSFIIHVTSHPLSYGNRLINFLDSGNSGGIGRDRRVGSGNDDNNDNDHHHQQQYHYHQKNVETGSDSSLAEISFQPLRELESVSASQVYKYKLGGKQFSDDNPAPPSAPAPAPASSSVPAPNLSVTLSRRDERNFHRRRRTHHRQLEDDQRHRQRHPAEFSNEDSSSPAANGLNEISYPEEDETEAGPIVPLDFLGHTIHIKPISNDELNEKETNNGWELIKRQQHPFSFGPTDGRQSFNDVDANNKRNALAAFKRQKFKSHQTEFVPSISTGAMSTLGDFFKNLKANLEFMEKGKLNGNEEELLEGDHPITMLREELDSDGTKPTGTAAFLHAIRTYRPSQRIRSLVALNPEGYHGSQFLDPNYMWVGLGKRK